MFADMIEFVTEDNNLVCINRTQLIQVNLHNSSWGSQSSSPKLTITIRTICDYLDSGSPWMSWSFNTEERALQVYQLIRDGNT